MRLLIENQLTHAQYEFNVEDKLSSRLFYAFDITLPSEIKDGIYQYTLYNDNEVKATGLMQIGDFVPDHTQYNTPKESNGYITYNG